MVVVLLLQVVVALLQVGVVLLQVGVVLLQVAVRPLVLVHCKVDDWVCQLLH